MDSVKQVFQWDFPVLLPSVLLETIYLDLWMFPCSNGNWWNTHLYMRKDKVVYGHPKYYNKVDSKEGMYFGHVGNW